MTIREWADGDCKSILQLFDLFAAALSQLAKHQLV